MRHERGNPMHSALREATQAAHAALDRHPLMQMLLSPTVDRRQYATALASLAAPQAGFEAQLADYVASHQLTEMCPPRHPLLEADLRSLETKPFPAAPIPPAENDTQRLGMLYVLEGAHLGGAVIAKHLMRHLPDAPVRYFQAGGNPMPRWQAFWQHATPHLHAGNLPEVIAGALTTFRFYAAHLTACMRYCER